LWIAIPVILVIAVFVALGRLSSVREVKVASAVILTESQAQSVLSATGYVVAERQAAVASKATGRLEYLAVEEGDTIAKGQIIGRIENADMEAALDLAKANLEQASANSLEASLEFNRQRELLAGGYTTTQAFEVAQARQKSASAAVSAARASMRGAEVALENTFIRAPFNGTVLTKHADVGEVVAPFASSASSKGAVVDLADMNSLEVEADVSEANIQRVERGQRCEIILDAYPHKRYEGYVKKIVPTADRSRATVLTKVAFKEIDRNVLPQMSARINFLSTDVDSISRSMPDSVVAVPNSAIVMRDGRQMVYTIVDDKARSIEIEIGAKFGNMTQIIKGIEPRQKIILSPSTDLKNGDKVKITE
jgi:RND family efflux transporter MFP subunit